MRELIILAVIVYFAGAGVRSCQHEMKDQQTLLESGKNG